MKKKWTYSINKRILKRQRPGDPPWPGEVWLDNWEEVSKFEYEQSTEQRMKSRPIDL